MVMDSDKALKMAKEVGFEVCAPLEPGKLEFLQAVRDMCAADKCRNFNKSWSCPPACGSLEHFRELCGKYTDGILVQTICRMTDEYDYESVDDVADKHNELFYEMVERLINEDNTAFAMGMGGCKRCESCTYPDDKCRFPEKLFPSMEACGLLVSDVCKANGVPYYYGPNTVAYVSCFLFDPKG